ncbi:ATP synthase F0 subunit B [Thermodesulfobacterium thermophilum]|uniref:ATP synthase F0 subunit B n=1 Tax=Thermodesulfobacterium thermophilum TaxID=886 RepID=UPI0003B55760|nr:ATP synthase F0 subunit B [Thermodesulfobacterium thermophilum]
MINVDFTLFVQIAEALIMTFILYHILIKPVMKAMQQREQHFASLEKETQELLNSASDIIKKYEEELAKARAEGAQKRELLKEEARKIEKELLSKVLKEVEEYKARWSQEFTNQLEAIRKDLQGRIEMFAGLIVERVLGRKV